MSTPRIRLGLLAFACLSDASMGQLAGKNDAIVPLLEKAADSAGVVISPRGRHGDLGVSTYLPNPKLKDGVTGDPAFKFYLACWKHFALWSEASCGDGIQGSGLSEDVDGDGFPPADSSSSIVRVRTSNGDFLGITYQPPQQKESTGTVVVCYVDGAGFVDSREKWLKNRAAIRLNRPTAEQAAPSDGDKPSN